MAPRPHSAKNGRQPAPAPRRATAIVTSTQPTAARRSARLVAKDPQLGAKRKHPRDSEAESDIGVEAHANEPKSVRPAKRHRASPPSLRLPLTAMNVRRMDGGSARDAKRPSSRLSAAASDATQETARTQRSSGTTAFYRYTYLAAAQVYIHTKPPDDIRKAIDAIVNAKPAEERRDELKAISQAFYNGCDETIQAAVSEDDFVELLLVALRAMSHSNLCFRVKADWREELKPMIQQSGLDLNFMNVSFMADEPQQEADDAWVPPPKRRQQPADQPYMSPQNSMTDPTNSAPLYRPLEPNTMPFPAPPSVSRKEGDRSLIKTPRPDISIGTQHMALISALASEGLNRTKARLFLAELQEKTTYRQPDGPPEPMLISVPALRSTDLVFPFAVIEGKAYSTGKQVFEAENQAAVSGACGLKIQLCLDDVVKSATLSSDISPTPLSMPPPLFFSICTQGPYHELWAHYTHMEDGVRKFNQVLVEICNGALQKSVEPFLVAVDNVLRWGTGAFLDSVVERLRMVAKRAGA